MVGKRPRKNRSRKRGPGSRKNYVAKLNKLTLDHHGQAQHYDCAPELEGGFTVTVYLGDQQLARAYNENKSKAHQEAALAALRVLNLQDE